MAALCKKKERKKRHLSILYNSFRFFTFSQLGISNMLIDSVVIYLFILLFRRSRHDGHTHNRSGSLSSLTPSLSPSPSRQRQHSQQQGHRSPQYSPDRQSPSPALKSSSKLSESPRRESSRHGRRSRSESPKHR